MTRKLFYEDCLLREFTAAVLSCEKGEKGYQITLDATAFYPGGGGQPCDLGTLADAKVLSVYEEALQIVHLCDGPLPVGAQVRGTIDWQRRLDLMQQHAGEHIVSGILHRKYGCHNVGFHMGAEVITIDFDCPIPVDELKEAEAQANRAIYENLPITCWYPTRQELATLAYRSKKELPWPVRIVQIPGYDTCACCGLHVAYTGQIGLIKLLSCVKFHAGVRIEMVCGARALEYLNRIYEQNKLVCQAFSVKPEETAMAAARMNQALAEEKFRASGLERQVFDHIARNYQEKGSVLHFAQALTPSSVRELADRIARQCGGTAAVASGSDETGYSICLVNHNLPVAQLGKQLNEELNGKGGGKAGFFQGSVNAHKEQIRQFFGKLNQF